MDLLKLALDWTPNVNHIGFFVALEKGFYRELGVEVEISDPSDDNYAITPAKKVELGKADFALCPTESILSYRTKTKAFDLKAIAAILQEDLSAIVVKKDSAIQTPKNLDGKTYSSYKARYEDGIVKAMIKNDGGKGDLNIIYPDKLNIWEGMLNGEANATWIFLNWEGVEIEKSEEEFLFFQMRDYQIPYSYSPVIAASERMAEQKQDAYQRFLEATKKGFLYAQENPNESLYILQVHLPIKDLVINLKRALELTESHFGNEESWGIIDTQKLDTFLTWISEQGLEEKRFQSDEIATNKFLRPSKFH